MKVLIKLLFFFAIVIGNRSENDRKIKTCFFFRFHSPNIFVFVSEMSLPKCRYEDRECILNLCNQFFKLSGTYRQTLGQTLCLNDKLKSLLFFLNILIANGIPQVNLVPTNPYEIRNVTVETGANGPINLKIQFKRANMTGIHLFHIDKLM